MPDLFDKTRINGLTLKNRFVRSATWEGLAGEDGGPDRRLEEFYAKLAEQELGLIIQGHAYVRPEGQAGVGQLGIHDDRLIPAYARIARAVHDRGGVICAQLAHAGLLARTDLSGLPALAPSPSAKGLDNTAQELTPEEIGEIALAMARAAARAREAGYDAVQIHAAHNYLLSQFLSPRFNRRRDEYGGSLENRVRALVEAVDAVREEVGPDYPVLVKINASDFLDDGLTEEDSIRAARILSRRGVDAVELSGGNQIDPKLKASRPGRITPGTEVYYRSTARAMKAAIDCPLILVGGIRSLNTAKELLEEKAADYIALCRPLIREPGLVKRWRSGDMRPSGCLQDNSCYKPIMAGEGISCPTIEKASKETEEGRG